MSMNPVEDSDLLRCRDHVAELFATWIGPPADPTWSSVLVTGPFDCCCRNVLLREYTLVIRADYRFAEQRIAAMCHEMFHRYTIARHGPIREPWVAEMMAFLTSQQALSEIGYPEYAAQREKQQLSGDTRLSVAQLKHHRIRRGMLGFGAPHYPSGYAHGVAIAGRSLAGLLSWSEVCALARAGSWNEWLMPLAPEQQARVARMLELDVK